MVVLADLVPRQVTALKPHQKSQVPLGDSNVVFLLRSAGDGHLLRRDTHLWYQRDCDRAQIPS